MKTKAYMISYRGNTCSDRKILPFIASLIAASLPVTGFLYLEGKKEKKKMETYLS